MNYPERFPRIWLSISICIVHPFGKFLKRAFQEVSNGGRLFLSPTSPRLYIAIKSEDYRLKAVSLITGKGQKVPAAAVFALQADKAVVEIAAVQIPVKELLNIRTEKSI